MADKYDSNGDYKNYSGSNSSDFKRKNLTAENSSGKNQEETHEDDENGEQNPAAQKAAEYIRELLAEKIAIDHGKCAHAARLLDQGIYFDKFFVLTIDFMLKTIWPLISV